MELKHFSKLFTVIALAISVFFAGCDNPTSGDTNNTPQTAATPTANPEAEAGPVVSGTTVTLSTATSGAAIYYTLDGTAPTTSGTRYTAPISITFAVTIKAIAVKAGMYDSGVLTAAYTIQGLTGSAATPTASPEAGTVAAEGATVTLSTATSEATIYYTLDGTMPTTESNEYSTPISVTSAVTIKAIAVKAGMNHSGVLTAAYTIQGLTGSAATPTASPEAGTVASGTTVTLSTTTEGASIYYTTDGTTMPTTTGGALYSDPISITADITIKAIAVKAGMNHSGVLTAVYTLTPAATPTATPPAGPVASGTTVALSTATTGAVIYYTTNGDDPTAESTQYSTPISVTADITIKAIAVKDGMNNSGILSSAYIVVGPFIGSYTSSGKTLIFAEKTWAVKNENGTLAKEGAYTYSGNTATLTEGSGGTAALSGNTVTVSGGDAAVNGTYNKQSSSGAFRIKITGIPNAVMSVIKTDTTSDKPGIHIGMSLANQSLGGRSSHYADLLWGDTIGTNSYECWIYDPVATGVYYFGTPGNYDIEFRAESLSIFKYKSAVQLKINETNIIPYSSLPDKPVRKLVITGLTEDHKAAGKNGVKIGVFLTGTTLADAMEQKNLIAGADEDDLSIPEGKAPYTATMNLFADWAGIGNCDIYFVLISGDNEMSYYKTKTGVSFSSSPVTVKMADFDKLTIEQ
jgi:hypothetical protein